MKEKLALAWPKIKEIAGKIYSWSPFATGLLIGYFCKPLITLALKSALQLIKFILG